MSAEEPIRQAEELEREVASLQRRLDRSVGKIEILASVLRTCWQQGKDAFQQLVALLRAPQSMLLDLVPASLTP
jgi:hypothetical protein